MRTSRQIANRIYIIHIQLKQLNDIQTYIREKQTMTQKNNRICASKKAIRYIYLSCVCKKKEKGTLRPNNEWTRTKKKKRKSSLKKIT